MKTKKTTVSKTAEVAQKKCSCKKTAKPAVKKAKTVKKSVKFTLHADKGKKVYLAGQFNDWDPSSKKMTYNEKGGYYAVEVKLAEGTYEYKFVVDGIWCADPENADCVQNDQGTFNSVIVVK
jgi:1,4-alpha-glucan branching enzyme